MGLENKPITRIKIVLLFLGYFILFAFAQSIGIMSRRFIGNNEQIKNAFSEIIRTPLTILSFIWLTRWSLQSPLINNRQHWTITLFWAFIGSLLPAICDVYYITFHAVHYQIKPLAEVNYIKIFALIMWAIGAGVTEEYLFRGYLFKLLKQRTNTLTAILIPAFIWTTLHLLFLKEHTVENIIPLLFTGMILGIMFSMVYITTGNIWNAILVHVFIDMYRVISWELTSFYVVSNNVLLTGGGMHSSASLPANISYIIVIIALYINIKRVKILI